MSLPSDVTDDVTEAMERVRLPRPSVSRGYTPEQRGWAAAIVVAFLGIAFVGPAWARVINPKRSITDILSRRAHDIRRGAGDAGKETRKKIRRMGDGRLTR